MIVLRMWLLRSAVMSLILSVLSRIFFVSLTGSGLLSIIRDKLINLVEIMMDERPKPVRDTRNQDI